MVLHQGFSIFTKVPQPIFVVSGTVFLKNAALEYSKNCSIQCFLSCYFLRTENRKYPTKCHEQTCFCFCFLFIYFNFEQVQTIMPIHVCVCLQAIILIKLDLFPFLRLQPNSKCIIFVNRVVTARSLSLILQKLKILASWKCDFLVGINAGLKMSRKTMNIILERFQSGEVMLYVLKILSLVSFL